MLTSLVYSISLLLLVLISVTAAIFRLSFVLAMAVYSVFKQMGDFHADKALEIDVSCDDKS
jgi:hypothetical protein